MHDIRELDNRGIPGGFVASEAFREAAAMQGKALGFNANRVFVPHPIQGRSDSEIRTIADASFPDVLSMIVGADPAAPAS